MSDVVPAIFTPDRSGGMKDLKLTPKAAEAHFCAESAVKHVCK